ncbi:MAG: M16 family metallopeptidase [Calditrichaceae bacterium]
MKSLKLYMGSLLLLFLLSCTGAKQEIKMIPISVSLNPEDILPVDPNIIKGKLDNGLTYYIRKNATPEYRAELRLVVNAGSVLEEDDQQGLAHFVEHMSFNGTENFQKQELVSYLESVGMRFGPDINAYTSFDETVYMLQLPTDSSGVLGKGVQVLEDWACALSFDHAEIDKERGVIIEEWRLGRGSDARMRDKQLPVLFKDSRYAERLPIGQKALLDTFKYETLKKFYKDWYRPDLMAVIAVGDFNPEYMQDLIKKHFGAIPPVENPRTRPLYGIPDHKLPRYAIASDPEATRSLISIYHKLPVTRDATVTDYRNLIIEALYSNMLNQRLDELTRLADPPFFYAISGKGRFVRNGAYFILSAMAKENGIPGGMKALLTEAKRLQEFGFTESELEREKASLLRGMEQAYKERSKSESAGFAAEYTRNFLEDEPIPGIVIEYEIYKKYLPGIKLAEVNGLTAKWLSDNNRTILVNSPEKESIIIPTEQELSAVIDSVAGSSTDAYVDDATDEPLVDFIPQASPVIKTKYHEKLDLTEWKLGNGATVFLKPTDYKNDDIRFTAFSPGGLSLIPDSNLVAAKTATGIIVDGGVAQFSKIQLEKMLSGKVVRISPYIGEITEGISGQASPQDLETMFQLSYLYFTQPREDSTAFLSYKAWIESYYRNRDANPEAAFQDTVTSMLTGNHPRFRPLQTKNIQEMDLRKSIQIFSNRFADASDFTFFFVGNFEPESIRPLIETWIGGLPSKNSKEIWSDRTYEYPTGISEKSLSGGTEPKSLNSITFTGPFKWSPDEQYKADAMVSVLNIRLRERIREDLGGTYGVRVSGVFSHYPVERYRIRISFGSDPERVEELTKEIFTVISDLKNNGTTEDYLNKVKEMDTRELEINMKDNGYWLNALEYRSFNGIDPADILKTRDRIDRLTVGDIENAADKYLNTDNYFRVVLYPETVSRDKQIK